MTEIKETFVEAIPATTGNFYAIIFLSRVTPSGEDDLLRNLWKA